MACFRGFSLCVCLVSILPGGGLSARLKRSQEDKQEVFAAAGSCASIGCFASYDRNRPCQCNSNCPRYRNCCSDFDSLCLGNSNPSPSPSPNPSPSPPSGGSGDGAAYWNGVNTNSKSALASRIRSGARRISYSGLWTAYKSVWVGLPGGCSSGINDIYSKKCWPAGTGQCGSFRREGDCYNREHSWPKSWWGGSKNDAYSDMFHVMPSDGYVNGKRSNLLFGEVGSASYVSSEGCKVGSGVFEPTDRVKGLVARGSLYMELRYGYSKGSSYKNLLLKWDREHPPTALEQEFNNRVQGKQGNRNPFIDFPGIAESVLR
jgi:hypothetical protein